MMVLCLYCKSYWDCKHDKDIYDENKECVDFVEGIDDTRHEHNDIDISSPAWVYQDLMR